MQLLSVVDLCARWTYTRAGVYKLVKTDDFPQPAFIVSCGRTKLFSDEDIENYEKDRPWLFDKSQKLRRQALYCRLEQVKEAEPHEKQRLLAKLFGNSLK